MHNALLRYLLASPRATDVEFFEDSRRWAALYAHEERLEMVTYRNDRARDRPLNVGYMCDFVHTPLAQHTLVPQFRVHNRARVRVCYYNHGPDSDTARAVSDVYRDVRGLDNDSYFRQIQSDGVDILVDLNGRLRVDNRYDVLCRKPAPIQVNWYNLLASTGLRAFDFIVADNVTLPGRRQAGAVHRGDRAHRVRRDRFVGGCRRRRRSGRSPVEQGRVRLRQLRRRVQEQPGGAGPLVPAAARDERHHPLSEEHGVLRAHLQAAGARLLRVSRGIAAERLRLENGSKFHDMRARSTPT